MASFATFARAYRAPDADSGPPWPMLIGEVGALRNAVKARMADSYYAPPVIGNGAPVLTIPGFLADDWSMRPMRRALNHAGYKAKRWKLGFNGGAKADTLDRLHERVARIADEEGRAVHLVGWSLGGIYAREFAKAWPDEVASITTMGAPFSGSPRANNVWRLYETVARHSVDAPPIPRHSMVRPPVPTFAIWSPRDGAIAQRSARGSAAESDRQIMVDCRHVAFPHDPRAIDAVLACVSDVEAGCFTD